MPTPEPSLTTIDKLKQLNVASFASNNNLAYFLVFLANFFWVSGFVYSNEHNMSFIESQLSRYLMQALITYTICKFKGYPLQFRSAYQFQVLFIRSFIFTIHSFVLGWSQFYLPLYVVHTISAFGPIFVCILNYFIYKKAITSRQMGGIVIAFAGILLTVNGRSIYHWIDSQYEFVSDFKHYKSDDPGVILVVSLIFFVMVVFWAYAILLTKKNEHQIVEVVYHQAICGVIGTALGYQFLPVRVAAETFGWSILYTGLVLGGGFTIFNIGLSLSDNTGVCSLITQATVVIGYGYSVFRYGEPLNIICVLGAVLLTSGVFVVLIPKTYNPKPEKFAKKAAILYASLH